MAKEGFGAARPSWLIPLFVAMTSVWLPAAALKVSESSHEKSSLLGEVSWSVSDFIFTESTSWDVTPWFWKSCVWLKLKFVSPEKSGTVGSTELSGLPGTVDEPCTVASKVRVG